MLFLAALACVQPAGEWPGPRPDGSILLPSGWSLRPHGKQVELASDLPVRIAGRGWFAVQQAGYREHVVTFCTDDGGILASLPLETTWSGMAWHPYVGPPSGGLIQYEYPPNTGCLMVSGGVNDCVHVVGFDPTDPQPTPRIVATWKVGDPSRIDLPAGMCFDDKYRLFVVLQRGQQVVRLTPEGKQDLVVPLPADAFPFECVASRDGRTIYVSLWGQAQVWALDADTGQRRASIGCGQHPSEMVVSPDGQRLFVSNANENTVSVVDLATHTVEETLVSSLFPDVPPGSTPNSIAIDPAGRLLLIANADNNNLAVLDVSERRRSQSLGFIPVGAYPTSVRFDGTGKRVVVANGKGSGGSRANPAGPRPEPGLEDNVRDYLGSMFTGSLSVFDLPQGEELGRLTQQAYACAPLAATQAVRGLAARPADSPIPAKVGDPSPIRHCVYIIKENRTYDQIFGDVAEGRGDPDLCLFPERVTPNHHAIARAFVLLDNFYVESEVSADGHEWTMGAYATDFVERSWPVLYGGKGAATIDGQKQRLGYPAEGNFAIATPRNGYLFDLAKAAGITYRSYGEFVGDPDGQPEGTEPQARIPALVGHFDPKFKGYDLDHSDVTRAERFLEELREFEATGDYPRLVVLRLPNDHTAGTKAGKLTPRAYLAQNDRALGMVLEGLSRSRFWPAMAVFVVEDDAQNGPDHVDAHRTVALVAGPFVKRQAVVSTMYSTCSMLRTMELILGLPPMSQFDAAARPMYDCFQAKPDATAYAALPARWSLEERNEPTAWGAEQSESFDLSREDAADDLALNEVIWRSVKGAHSPMPAPRRAAFVRVLD